ncbi:hypothetical protein [Sutcliffiella rhizosphaerae]|uniref:Glycerophosphoryl diester phosphodiesterase membrane domain-containing protein n=1 Tax=Sutcliffiella rhizosphaerae TaxID=2880967 RepID=A0ABN8AE70_9BACI|nr:hypothetical protein [Sutcliffiella rhizosphaerae]CAG9623581.1 hypothetical protein BACCIP111883_04399 [Sutcliffiella rhizosphaerae]
MNNRLNEPKSFGEILDHTFRISKYKFKDFFIILLCLVGPVYLLEAIMQLASGRSFFRDLSGEGSWIDQIANSFLTEENTSLASDLNMGFTFLILLITYPIAQAAILIGVNQLKFKEEKTVGTLIKMALGRFFPMVGSTILFTIIAFAILVAVIFIGTFSTAIFFMSDLFIGIIFSILIFFGLLLLGGYFLTRLSFYFGSSVIDKSSPGLGRSWSLTSGQTFKMIGLYLIFFMITSAISFAIEGSFSLFLGNSVLLGLIVSFTSLFTTLIMAVGYSVMYLDLKVRHDADDLKEMIDEYNTN